MKADAERMVRMAELEIDPARIGDYIALLREEIEASVAKEPGVLMLHAVTVKGAPENVRILEVYANRQDYEAHIQTPHFLKYKTLTADMVKALNLVDVDPIVLCAK
ncbi:antibiotic biosynthesis monooxygenase [Pararhizobium polonicum]|uniref:Antibiotic biosynthesis monooxygenase n=1 Tax=Pararhizobium polonicum TaxID=1612624 RepID=A0A1C7NUS5_9HYPH|nr:antibiotic biosynthesis monooxygenase [Pararhizobium polonicum]OBZ92722.1 antibiotic biosynthesis monooxygenase [Pararhizobium polonicum]